MTHLFNNRKCHLVVEIHSFLKTGEVDRRYHKIIGAFLIFCRMVSVFGRDV